MSERKAAPKARERCPGLRTAVVALAMVVTMPLAARAQEAEPELVTYRFWRAPSETLVESFASIPWSALSFERDAAQERAVYAAVLEVRDTTGAVLLRDAWEDTVVTAPLTPASRMRASTTRRLAPFRVQPGRYTAVLTLTDPKTGQSRSTERPLTAFAEAPVTSDLVLAAGIDEVEQGAAPGDALVRGTVAVLPNLVGRVTAENARVGFLAEIYRPRTAEPETAQVVVAIDGVEASNFHYQTPPQTRVFQGGGVDALSLNLVGLPPGSYTLQAKWAIGGDTVRARHPLQMLPPGAGQVAYAQESMYEGLTEAQLDSVFEPMRYILAPEDEVAYESLGSADAKRRFLGQVWQDAARQTGTNAQQLRADWDERLAYVNLNFEKPGGGRNKTHGWQSDRGRIYLTYGPPAETLQERQRQDQMNPWEAWKYITGRGDKYIFWDQTGFGDYILVYSTNPAMPGTPGWEQFMTPEAVNQIKRW